MNIKHKLIIITVFSLFIFNALTAQSGWQRQSPLPTGESLTDVKFITSNEGWAVGYNGTIIHTLDGGYSWENLSIDTLGTLNSVFFTTPDSGWIVGESGLVIHTSDGGITWEQQTVTTIENLLSVFFTDSNHGWIVGPPNFNYRTTDGGNTWNSSFSGIDGYSYSVCFSDINNGWTCGDSILYTSDGGISWNYQSHSYSPTKFSVCFTDQNNGWVVGDAGVILYTNDGGTTWNPQTSPTSLTLLTVHFTNANTGWTAGLYGSLYYTNDGGQTWTGQDSGVDINKSISSIFAFDQNNVWGVASAGVIINTEDGGNSWHYQRNGTASTLVSVDFVDKNNGWAMTYMGEIVNTTNGGIDWEVQRFGSMMPYNQLFFINSLQGWRVGEAGIIEVTTDGGYVWTDQISGIPYTALNSVYFLDAEKGWAVGDSSYIVKTVDGGNTWIQKYNDIDGLLSVCFSDINNGWAVGSNGTILHSSNGGVTWVGQISNTFESLNSVCFTDNNHGFVVGNNGIIINTDNGGNSWYVIALPAIAKLGSICMVNKNRGYIAGDGGTILYTGNGGVIWEIQDVGTMENFQSVKFADANNGWAVGESGAIFHTMDGGNQPVSIFQPSEDRMNYPQIEAGDSLDFIVEIYNPGILNLNISAITISGTDAGDFIMAEGGELSTLIPDDTNEIILRFKPSDDFSKSAWMVVASDASSSPDSIFLTGNNSIIELNTIPQVNQAFDITIEAPQNLTPTTARIFFRQGGNSAWQMADLETGPTDYIVTIPSYAVTVRGIEYFIRFSDGITEITYPEINPMENPDFIKTRVSSINPDSALTSEKYKMISFPLNLNEPYLDTALEDDYGVYDNTLWRLLKWNPIDDRYEEYPDFGNEISSGKAYWLITRDAERFDVEDGYSVPTYGSATITIYPGWNQIGNPFAFTVNWYNITNSSMVNPPYYWNGDSYEYDVALIAPWEGYFVYSPQPTEIDLYVPPEEAAILKKTASDFSGLSNGEFVIQLKAKGTKSGLKDEQNFVGMRTFSGDGFDVHDYPEAPAIINNLNLSVLENDTLYAGNFKSISSEGACWNLQLTSSKKESEVIIDLQFFNELPESFKIYFLDLDYKCMILVKGNKAIVDWDDLNVRNLKLIVGKESYVNRHSENIPLIPVKFTLSQNYPNPFNPETTIRYTLAKQCQVKIEIYNILGQKINILVNKEQSTGNHFISWSGKNRTGHKVGSGVYFYRVMTDDFTAVRKMILLR